MPEQDHYLAIFVGGAADGLTTSINSHTSWIKFGNPLTNYRVFNHFSYEDEGGRRRVVLAPEELSEDKVLDYLLAKDSLSLSQIFELLLSSYPPGSIPPDQEFREDIFERLMSRYAERVGQ